MPRSRATPEWTPYGVPDRPDRLARRAGRDPGARTRAHPARPHDGLAVHLLPWGRVHHGLRPGFDPSVGTAGAGVRRRPPLELRRLRLARTRPDVRHERLRRDVARALGVGPQASGDQLRGRGPRPGLRYGAQPLVRPRTRPDLPHGHARVRGHEEPGGLVRQARRGDAPCLRGPADRPEGGCQDPEAARQGAGQEQPAGLRETGRGQRRGRSPDPERPARAGAVPGAAARRRTRAVHGVRTCRPAQLPPHTARRPPASARELPRGRRGAQGRGRGQRRHACERGAPAGTRRAGSALPADEGSAGVGPGALRGQEPLQEPRASGWSRASG